MATTKEEIQLREGTGIYYTNSLLLSAGDGTLEVEKIVFTSTVALIDTEATQKTARHIRHKLVLIKGRL